MNTVMAILTGLLREISLGFLYDIPQVCQTIYVIVVVMVYGTIVARLKTVQCIGPQTYL